MNIELFPSIPAREEKSKMSINKQPARKINYMAIGSVLGGILWVLTGNFIFFVIGISVAAAYEKRY
jgi:hypothetical protein